MVSPRAACGNRNAASAAVVNSSFFMGPTVSAGNFYCKFHLSKHTFLHADHRSLPQFRFLISYRLVSIEFFLLFSALKFSCTQN